VNHSSSWAWRAGLESPRRAFAAALSHQNNFSATREELCSLHKRQFFLHRHGSTDASSRNRVDLGPDGVRNRKTARVEAVLFVSESALSARRLAQLATLADSAEAVRIVDELNVAYDRDGSAFRVEPAANGYLLLTRPVYARWLGRLHQRQTAMKLSPPAMETLTVIAYRQPITRADIEAVRGVQCTEMLKQLMDRGLVRIAGEDNSLGRPYLYETTRKFLEVFGLRSLGDLPRADYVRTVPHKDSVAVSADVRHTD
jgi:segregation and condensation protein B